MPLTSGAVAPLPTSFAHCGPNYWYYVDLDGAQQGPVDESTLKAEYRTGEVDGMSLLWRPGQKGGWLKLDDLSSLKTRITQASTPSSPQAAAAPPPVPSPQGMYPPQQKPQQMGLSSGTMVMQPIMPISVPMNLVQPVQPTTLSTPTSNVIRVTPVSMPVPIAVPTHNYNVVSSATSPTGCYWDTTTTPDSLKINTLTTSTVACTPKYKCICAPTPVKQKELLDENLMDKQQGRIV